MRLQHTSPWLSGPCAGKDAVTGRTGSTLFLATRPFSAKDKLGSLPLSLEVCDGVIHRLVIRLALGSHLASGASWRPIHEASIHARLRPDPRRLAAGDPLRKPQRRHFTQNCQRRFHGDPDHVHKQRRGKDRRVAYPAVYETFPRSGDPVSRMQVSKARPHSSAAHSSAARSRPARLTPSGRE